MSIKLTTIRRYYLNTFTLDEGGNPVMESDSDADQFIKEHKSDIRKALQLVSDTTLSRSEKAKYDKLIKKLDDISEPQIRTLSTDDYTF